MWIASRCTLRVVKFQHFPRGHVPRPPYKCMLCTQCTSLPSKILPLCVDKSGASQPLRNYTSLCLTKAKVLLSLLTHSSPFPIAPCLKEAENLLQQLPVFLQQKTVEENAYIMEIKYHFNYIRCVTCVIVYMSACKQCCILCNNSYHLVYNEKFRGATYITACV